MFKAKNLFIFMVLTTLIFGASFSVPTAAAQEEAFNPNTPISDLEGELAMPEMTGSKISHPRRGPMKQTPEKIPAKYLDLPEKLAPGGESSAESVIGADGRTKVINTTVYPYRVIAYLSMQFGTSWYRCTGWIVGPRLVVTAGHCVYEPGVGGRGWAKKIYVYPGKNGAIAPYGSRSKYRLFSVTGWTGSGSPDYDYGAIQVSGTAFTNWFGYQALGTYPGTHTISGYPGDIAGFYQWKMSGAISSFTANRLRYYMDTYGGQSGAPIYHTFNSVCCYGVGIHAYGGSINSGTRITLAKKNNITYWRGYPYP
jgi:glutamyl endopeptidase